MKNMMLNTSQCPGHLTHQISIRYNTLTVSWIGSSEFKYHPVAISRICVIVAKFIWYNLSPKIYQGLMASMPRRAAAVCRAKGGSTRH